MGFGVWGLGFGVWGLGFGVWGLGFRVEIARADGAAGFLGQGACGVLVVGDVVRYKGTRPMRLW